MLSDLTRYGFLKNTKVQDSLSGGDDYRDGAAVAALSKRTKHRGDTW